MSIIKASAKKINESISTLLFRNITLWIDEVLYQKGFTRSAKRGLLYSGQNTGALTPDPTLPGRFKFFYERLPWYGTDKISKIYIGSTPILNDETVYTIDYHNGTLTFLNWNSIVSTYGSNPIISADYTAKEYYVLTNPQQTIYPIVDFALGKTETLPGTLRLPIIACSIEDNQTEPYELGGTAKTGFIARLFMISEFPQINSAAKDAIRSEIDTQPFSVVPAPLYESDGTLKYDNLDSYLTACTGWYKWWINDVRSVSFGGSPDIREIVMDISVLGKE